MAIKKLTVEEWRQEIWRGLDFRRQFGMEKKWAEVEALFYAADETAVSSGPNLMISTGDALLSTLSVPSPVYSVDARTQETVNKALVLESILNSLLCEMDVADEVETMCLYGYMWGTGILKLGYDSEFGYAPEHDIGVPWQPAGATLTSLDAKGRQIEFGANGPGKPWVAAIMPHDFVVPYGTKKLKNAQWAAHRVVRHIDEVKADPKYEHTRNLRANMSMEDFVRSYSDQPKSYRMGNSAGSMPYLPGAPGTTKHGSGALEYVELWEIHDLQTRKVIVIATGYDEFLREEDDAMQVGGMLPFIDLAFVPRARSIWVTPDTVYLTPHQAELTDIHMQGDKQRRTAVAKYAVDPQKVSDDEIDRLTSADVGAVIKMEPGSNPRDAISQLPQSNNISLYQDANFVEDAARSMVGFSNNQFGQYDSSSRRTAKEAEIVADASGQRMSRRQTAVRNVYVKLGDMLQPIIFNFFTAARVIKYVGQDGVEKWTPYHGDALAGDYALKVTFVNEGDPTPTQKKQAAVQQAMMLAKSGMPMQEIMKFVLQQLDNPALTAAVGGAISQVGAQNAQPQQPDQPAADPPGAQQGPVGGGVAGAQ